MEAATALLSCARSRKPPNRQAAVADYVMLNECAPRQRAYRLAQAEHIFFDTAFTRSFESEAARQAFLARWFGNYAEACPQAFLFALAADGEVTGYLAGCLDSFSPGANRIVAEIDYFTPSFCDALKNYPSHFHVNVKPGHQGKGIGHALVARFEAICAKSGSPGIHVATGAASRAVKFYEACGFRRVTPYEGASPGLAVLIRSLAPS
jgi:GNAT superfamily N-acetyltransferase